MSLTEFSLLPTMIGSMPHTDPARACAVITHYLKDLPAWPQLPKYSRSENMTIPFSEGFPGLTSSGDTVRVRRAIAIESLEPLYDASMTNNCSRYPIRREYAAGLYEFLSLPHFTVKGVKGQVTGPLTWGLNVTDETGKAMIYDENLADAVARFISLKACWEEQELKRVSPNTIIFIDEPFMSTYGSSTFTLAREKIINLINTACDGLHSIVGIHCCGNTDWPLLMATRTGIISFDTYNFAESLKLYPAETMKYFERGGAVAWGIVPNEPEKLARETVSSLKDRFEDVISPFTRAGLRFEKIIRQSLLTPSCGLAGLTPDAAEQVLKLLADLSEKLRQIYLTRM